MDCHSNGSNVTKENTGDKAAATLSGAIHALPGNRRNVEVTERSVNVLLICDAASINTNAAVRGG
jgi:hypothetical protein